LEEEEEIDADDEVRELAFEGTGGIGIVGTGIEEEEEGEEEEEFILEGVKGARGEFGLGVAVGFCAGVGVGVEV
jgi:hypothetical protein